MRVNESENKRENGKEIGFENENKWTDKQVNRRIH